MPSSLLFFYKISKEKITVRLMGRCVLWVMKYGKFLSLADKVLHQHKASSCMHIIL